MSPSNPHLIPSKNLPQCTRQQLSYMKLKTMNNTVQNKT